jgi:hypothetical protein
MNHHHFHHAHDVISEKQRRDRVMKHFTSIVHSKQQLQSLSQSQQPQKNKDVEDQKEQSTSVLQSKTIKTSTPLSIIASPPPQLISTLRQIYGSRASASTGTTTSSSSSSDVFYDSDGSGNSNTNSKTNTNNALLLPTLIQSIVEHSIFSNISSGNEEDVDSKKESDSEDDDDDDNKMDVDNDHEDDNKMDIDNEEESPRQSLRNSGIHSHVANLEALIGNACNAYPTSSNSRDKNDKDDDNNDNENDDGEFLLGI